MDVIFTIASRNYGALAATLMESVAQAEPAARRVVIATDGPMPHLKDRAEVIEASELEAPHAAMSVYYDALEYNTAVKPYAFLKLLGEPGVRSVTYLDPDIYVFRPMERVRRALDGADLALIPHLTRPLLGDALPNDHAILRSGGFNLGFAGVANTPKAVALMSWWADRCRYDCRVALKDGLFTDQRWMDLAPGFVDELAILRDAGLNLAYWNLEGRTLVRRADGWRVEGEPLVFFHFSGFDPAAPHVLSKHQDRVQVKPGSPLATLLEDYGRALMRNGHGELSRIPYAFGRFPSGRPIAGVMRRRALRAAREGEDFNAGVTPALESWVDGPDPEAAAPGQPDLTRTMAQVWRENPHGYDIVHEHMRLGWHQFFAEHAVTLGADRPAAEAARALLEAWRVGFRDPDPSVWQEAPWRGPACEALDWLRAPQTEGAPRAAKALLAARRDLRLKFGSDPDGLVGWCLGAEAAAGRFAPELLPEEVLARLAGDPAALLTAVRLSDPAASELKRQLSAGFGLAARAGWPQTLTAVLRAPFLEPAPAQPAPFIRLFLAIWESRPDLQRLFPLRGGADRFRFLRWLVGGGLAEYGVEFDALPAAVRGHPQMRLARLTLRSRPPSARPAPSEHALDELWVVESSEAAREAAADRVVYDVAAGRFLGPQGPAPAPAQVELVRFLTHPELVPADAVALHARGVRWRRAVGVWDDAVAASLTDASVGLGFVDEVWTSGHAPGLFRPCRTPALDAA